MENNKILIVDKLNKYFSKSGKLVKVLDNVSFDVYENDFMGIIGESGSGKSTIGKCIIRLYSSSSGNIMFDNKIINQENLSKKNKTWLCKNMSMIFQDPMSSLNSRKNVLSLISEPLIINKVIQKEAKKLIEKCYKINPFFKNTYKWQDYNLTSEYVLPFLKNNIDNFNDGIKQINGLSNDYSNLEELKNILINIENNFKLTLKDYVEYIRLIKSLINFNNDRYLSNDLHSEELKYRNAQKELEVQKMYLNAPKEYWDLSDEYTSLKGELDDYIFNSYNDFCVKSKSRLKTIKNQYISEIKSCKQNMLLTDSITKNLLEKTNLLILEDTLKAIKVLDKKRMYLKEEEIQDFINFIRRKIKQKYSHIIDDISSLNSIDEQLANVASLKLTNENVKELINDYKFTYGRLNNDYNFMKKVNSIKNDDDFIRWVSEINDVSEKLKSKVKIEIAVKQKRLDEISKEMKKIKDAFLSEDSEKQKMDECKKKLKESKETRDKFFEEENIKFDEKNLNLIYEQEQTIENLKKELYKSQKDFIKIVSQKFESIIKPYKKDNSKEKDIEIFKKDLKIKSSTIDAINFEIDTYNEDVKLYRRLRSTKLANLYLMYKPLKDSLIRSYVYEALNEVGLKSEHAYRYPHEFSGGQRQRIVIARALISRPKLIIADEPISALDVSIQAQVINIMKDLANKYGITYLFIAHDLSMVRYTSNRLIILHKGKIVEKGNTDEVFNNPIHPYTKSLIKASPELSKIHVDLASFSSKLDYDKKYSDNNMPKFFKIEEDQEHFVLATEGQFLKWTTKK